MANETLTPDIIAQEALMQLRNNLVMGNLVHQDYSSEFAKVGDTVRIRKPVKFQSEDGAAITQLNDVIEGNTAVTMSTQKKVAWEFDTKTLTLDIERYSERYIQPAMIRLAQDVDTAIHVRGVQDFWNFAGTPGTVPATFAALGEAGEVLDNMACPFRPRAAVHSPEASWALADGLKNVFVQDKARTAFEQGRIGLYAGFDNFKSQSVVAHTVGDHGGTPLVNGANQDVTYSSVKTTNEQTLLTDGWTNSTTGILKQGDVFTIAGVFEVNPVTFASTGKLRTFVVKADADSGATTGPATLTISPAIIVAGANAGQDGYPTVDAAPADDAVITVVTGTANAQYRQSLCFHKNALALVMRPLVMPDGAVWKAQASDEGISVRIIKQYDITTDKEIARVDILFGTQMLYGELGTRLTS